MLTHIVHAFLSKNVSKSTNVCVCSLGLLWQLRPSDVEVELLAHTRNVVSKDLEAETGLHTGWIQNGGLFIASNKQRLDEYKRLMSVRIDIAIKNKALLIKYKQFLLLF